MQRPTYNSALHILYHPAISSQLPAIQSLNTPLGFDETQLEYNQFLAAPL